MEKYLQVSSVEELNEDLAHLALEVQYLQDVVHKMYTTTSCFENTLIFPSIDMSQRYKKFKLEFQFFEDVPVVGLQYSVGNKVYVINSALLNDTLVNDTLVTDSVEQVLNEMFRLQEIAHIMAYEDLENADEESFEDDDLPTVRQAYDPDPFKS